MAGVHDDAGAAAGGGSVLLRRIAARRVADQPAAAPPDPLPVPAARTPERAVAAAVARAADRAHGMALFFDRVSVGHAVVAELAELFPEQALISVVQGPGDSLGAVAISPGLLTSVIEMQALGRISTRPVVPRRPTRTDGAICADFVSLCLAELGAELSALPGFDGMSGYRYASFLDDPRPLALMLEDVSYRLISATLRAGTAGQRDGQIVVLLPSVAARAEESATPVLTAEAAPPAAPSPGTGVLAETVQAVPIELIAVLCRRTLSLGELQTLSPGDRITLPPGVLTQATLETTTGQVLLRGRLGEAAGRHALRIAGAQGAAWTAPAGQDARAGGLGVSAEGPGGLTPWPGGAGAEAGSGLAAAPLPGGVEPPIDDLNAPDVFRDGLAAEAALPMDFGSAWPADDPAAMPEGMIESPPAFAAMQIG